MTMTKITRVRRGLAAALLAGAFALAGCAAAPDLTADDAASFREHVAAIAERSVAGDFAGANAELALLEAQVAEASAAGTLAESREAQIADAIALVRADLDAQIEAQRAAEQAARDAEAAAQRAAAEEAARVAAEQEAARRAAEEAARNQNDEGDGDGDGGDEGDGGGNGKGNKGNGNGRGEE